MTEINSLEDLFENDSPESLRDFVTNSLFREPVFSNSGQTFSLSTLQRSNFIDPTTNESTTTIKNHGKEKELDAFYQQQIEKLLNEYNKNIKNDDTKDEAFQKLITYIIVAHHRDYNSVLNSFKTVIRCISNTLDIIASFIMNLDDDKKFTLIEFLVKQKATDLLTKMVRHDTLKIILSDNIELFEPLSTSDDNDDVDFYDFVMKYCNSVPKKQKNISPVKPPELVSIESLDEPKYSPSVELKGGGKIIEIDSDDKKPTPASRTIKNREKREKRKKKSTGCF